MTPAPASTCRKCGAPISGGATDCFCTRCLFARVAAPLGEAAPAPRQIGGYEVLGTIAEGGMGVVYKARDARAQRTVALKMILTGRGTEGALKRFRTEAEAAAALDHPSIVPIYEVGEAEGQPYFTMKFIEGGSLAARLAQYQEYPRATAKLMATVARAIHHAHQRGILHRDLKPANILVNERDEPFVTDFGIARRVDEASDLTHTGTIMGTPNYMAPEQARGSVSDLTTATDVYSLGAILYHLLAGQPPFVAENHLEVLRLVQETEPGLPSRLNRAVDRDLETICLRCLEKAPANRYRSALELAEDLERWLGNETIIARRATPAERAVKWVRRKPVIAALAGACVLAVILGVVGVVHQWRQAEAARITAEQAQKLAEVRGNSEADARREEQLQRGKAEKSFRDTETLLTRVELEKADALLQADDLPGGLAYLARVLRRDPSNSVAAERLLSTLKHRAFAVARVVPVQDGNDWGPAAAFSPDLGRVVVGGYFRAGRGSETIIWDTQTGQAVGAPIRHKNSVSKLAFSHDGTAIVTGSPDRTARLWDSLTGLPLTPPMEHEDLVGMLALSRDDKLLVTRAGAPDRSTRVWNSQTGELVSGPVTNVLAVSAEGPFFLVPAQQTNLLVVNAQTGKVQATLGHDDAPWAGIFGESGRKVATVSSQLRVWRLNLRVPDYRVMEGSTRNVGRTLKFNHDENLLLFPSNKVVYAWRVATGKAAFPPLYHGDTVIQMVFSADDRRLFTASRDNVVHIWDTRTGQPLSAPLRHEARILGMAEAPDGAMLVVCRDHTLVHWSLLNSTPPAMTVVPSGLTSIRFSHDGKWVVTSRAAGGARILDARTGELQPVTFPHDEALVDARFSANDRQLITVDRKSVVRVWEVAAGEPFGKPMPHQLTVRSAQLSRDGRRALVGLEHGVGQVWDVATGACLHGPFYTEDYREFRATGSTFGAAQFSPEGKFVLFGTSNHRVTLLEVATGREMEPRLQHAEVTTCCCFSADGRRIITGSHDLTARVWEASGGKAVGNPLRHGGTVNFAALSADGRLAVTASEDRTARIWDADTGRPFTDSLAHAAPVLHAEFSPDATRVLTIARDGTVHLWDVRAGQRLRDPFPLATKAGTKVSASFSPDGSSIVLHSQGRGLIWHVPPAPKSVPDWLPALAETLGGQRIDAAGNSQPVRPTEVGQLRQSVLDRPTDEFYAREIRALFE